MAGRFASSNKVAAKVPKFKSRQEKSVFEIELIKFVSENPLIWDPNDEDYNRREKRVQTFELFSRRYPNNDQITADSCAMAWKSIRQSYRNARARYKRFHSLKSGQSNDDDTIVDEPDWKYKEELSFLEDILDASDSWINLQDGDQFSKDIDDLNTNELENETENMYMVECELFDDPKHNELQNASIINGSSNSTIKITKKRTFNEFNAGLKKAKKTQFSDEADDDIDSVRVVHDIQNAVDNQIKLIQIKLQTFEDKILTNFDQLSKRVDHLSDNMNNSDPNFNFVMSLMEAMKSIKSRKKLVKLHSQILALVVNEIEDD